jgi:histidinol-phosphate aminotransferase
MNKKLNEIDEYKPSDRTKKPNVYKLDWNECNLEFDNEFKQILSSCISDVMLSEYPDIHNDLLYSLLADYCGLQDSNIQIFNGSDSALHYIFAALLNRDSKVLVFNPNYNQIFSYLKLYSDFIESSDIIDPFDKHDYNYDDIKNFDLIYLSNPNNPTGKLLQIEKIENLLILYPDKYFVVDEAYFEFSKQSCCHLIKNFKNLIVTRTFSKAFSLASIRLGYICADKSIIKLINKIRNTKDVNSFAQALGVCVLQNKRFIDSRVEIIIENRERFQKELEKHGIKFVRSKANFVLVKTYDSKILTQKMLDNDILIRDRGMFKNIENTVRITIGDWQIMEKIINLIVENNYEHR